MSRARGRALWAAYNSRGSAALNAVKPSGPWASHLKKLNYTVAKQGSMLKTHTLLALNDMEPCRELMVRDNRDRTPSSFEHNIAQSARHVEAALGYVVGGLFDTPFTHCKREIGPFPHCVRVVGCEHMTACIGCHWNGPDDRCEYYVMPANSSTGTAIVTPDGQLLIDIKAAITAAEACFSANYDTMKDAEGEHPCKARKPSYCPVVSHYTPAGTMLRDCRTCRRGEPEETAAPNPPTSSEPHLLGGIWMELARWHGIGSVTRRKHSRNGDGGKSGILSNLTS
ncbi:hypothetical protein N7519_001019 [Penicillium mononematosum]|uniref:uncharacterized protein n=1 Tax=Penicillium mononematosum TaxID=268346 RepID=UPI002547A2BB|nr:uncharacterized protein N7519_001019 [Penicillium mononematosum]KAJ6190998.1 hypothetical protein N7519_001019 [Penicillium mononematosum]